MYSTCIFCHADLGANESVEHFPVGRRLAFDAEKGRLWAVCPRCARWNLSPLETRWEAIEECERLYRDTRLRASTENIGVARLPEGTDLVRIGRPRRPEFAAWRYGDQMGERRRRALGRLGGALALGGAGLAAGLATGGAALVIAPLLTAYGAVGAAVGYRAWQDHLRFSRVSDGEGSVFSVSGFHLRETTLAADPGDDGWALRLRHARGQTELRGAAARRVLGSVLVRVNEAGAGAGRVRAATGRIEAAGGPERLLRALARDSEIKAGNYLERRAAFRRGDYWAATQNPLLHRVHPKNSGALPHLGAETRLALEMAANEEAERRALEGELALLEAAWREAEAIAAVADRLAIPAEVERKLKG